jgi:DNA-3-methyladenine glycosylase
VEVEAYVGEDDCASHARFGPTARNAVMYGEPGRAYLYLVYGMHTCLNVVTEPPGRPAALLIRAVALEAGVETARRLRTARETSLRRFRDDPAAQAAIAARIAAVPAARLAAGPGLVGAAYGLDPAMTGLDLLDPGGRLRLEAGELLPGEAVLTTARIGVDYAGEPWVSLPWRLLVAGHPSVSRGAG